MIEPEEFYDDLDDFSLEDDSEDFNLEDPDYGWSSIWDDDEEDDEEFDAIPDDLEYEN